MQAVRLDPEFAAAELRLAILAADHDNAHFRKAIAHEASLAPRDRSLLDAYEGFVAGGAAAQSAIAPLDRHLARFPRDDVAWKVRAMLEGFPAQSTEVVDRWLAVDPSDANALAFRAFALARSHPEDASLAADRCVRFHPHADMCLYARVVVESSRGACTALEADARRLVFLSPDDGEARESLADALAATGAPVAAVRDAMNPTLATDESTFAFPIATLEPMYEGDFTEVERIAKDLEAQASHNRVMLLHFHPALALIRAYEESGDTASASRVAEEFLSRSPAWGEGSDMGAGPPLAALDGMLVATMARGGRMDRPRADARQAAAFRDLTASGMGDLEAWERAYADGVATPAEARSAMQRFEQVPLAAETVTSFPAARAFVLAGRGEPARAALEKVAGTCAAVTDGWRQVLAHFELAKLDEQAGNTPSACTHYATVLQRWGRARPRSVTADEARARVRALACP